VATCARLIKLNTYTQSYWVHVTLLSCRIISYSAPVQLGGWQLPLVTTYKSSRHEAPNE